MTMTIGLQASGKSTWAREEAKRTNAIIICRDDIRSMLQSSVRYEWKPKMEKDVTSLQKSILADAMKNKRNIIIADTNLSLKFRVSLVSLAKSNGYKVQYEFFTNVPLNTLIARDLKRERPVGADVIRSTAERYGDQIPWVIKKLPKYADIDTINTSGAPAIIVDIDGTIADMNGIRDPFEWDKVDQDKPHEDVIDLINAWVDAKLNVNIIVLSGRDSVCRDKTMQWLDKYFSVDGLFMREEGDVRPDWIVKQELYFEHIQPKYHVNAVFDDRNQVVEMWRKIGLRCYQVANGNF